VYHQLCNYRHMTRTEITRNQTKIHNVIKDKFATKFFYQLNKLFIHVHVGLNLQRGIVKIITKTFIIVDAKTPTIARVQVRFVIQILQIIHDVINPRYTQL